MKIHVKESSLVRPSAPIPGGSLWLSHLDLITQHYHTPAVSFYRQSDPAAANFFDTTLLKAALSHTLVHFYPAAGRLAINNNRIEINCNAEGVLFVEADCDCSMDELGDFSPTSDLSLVPAVDYSLGISTFPLMLFQITRFTCGGICLGNGNQHNLSDGISANHFIRTWSELTRGLDVSIPPFLERITLLQARNPPLPEFVHTEFQPSPVMKNPQPETESAIFSIFKLTRDQLNTLKAQCEENNYTTYEVLSGHLWRCVCKARGLPEDQESKLYMITEIRSRLQPPLPPGYYGNSIIPATVIAFSGDIQSKPLNFAVKKIRDALAGVNNDYIRSALDYLDLQPDLKALARGAHTFKCPSLLITSWIKLGVYDVDFGWGRPIFMGLGAIPVEGKSFVMPSPDNDGSLLYGISLPKVHVNKFAKFLYEFMA